MPVIDVKRDLEELTRLVDIDDDRAFILHPGEFVLGSTFERIAVAADLVARIEGKSSRGRLGLLIHSTDGLLAAGFDGRIPLARSTGDNITLRHSTGQKSDRIITLRT